MLQNICIAHGGDISKFQGGTNRVVAFIKALRNSGYNIHLVVPKPEMKFPKELKDTNIHIYTVPLKAKGVRNQILRAILISLKAKKIAEKNKAVLQIEHSTLCGVAALLGISNYILDIHDISADDPQYTDLPLSTIARGLIYNIEKISTIKAKKIIVVNEFMKRYIIERWGIPEERIEVIPNGYFEEKLKVFNYNVEEVPNMISFLGTLSHKIDINKIIKLAKSLNYSQIYIIGDGPMRSKLERMINRQGIKNVILTGRLPDEEAFSIIAKSQVVIFPLKISPYTATLTSVKLFDYGALGKAIVVDDVSKSEIWKEFRERKAAMFADPRNPDDFVKCVLVLLEDENLRRRLGRNAKRLVKKYTWEKLAERLVKLYKEEVLNENQPYRADINR